MNEYEQVNYQIENNNTNEMSDVMITKLERSEWFVTY